MSDIVTCHGVLLSVFNTGLLLTGESGIGKSELALTLIKNGHCLIADDSVELRVRDNRIVGSCPTLLQDFIEVRGLGIMNIRKLFGDNVLAKEKAIDLIIDLKEYTQMPSIDRLTGVYTEKKFFSQSIPVITIPVKAGRDLAVLVETAVMNQQLRNKGYYAEQQFSQQKDADLVL